MGSAVLKIGGIALRRHGAVLAHWWWFDVIRIAAPPILGANMASAAASGLAVRPVVSRLL